MPKLKEGQLYEVTWNDAFGSFGWQDATDLKRGGAYVCKTVGWFLGNNQAGDLLFAGTKNENTGLYNAISGRPVAMIKKIKRLK